MLSKNTKFECDKKGAPMQHPFLPVFDERSKILILGSFPSVRSREEGFFYGHPQNRFWKVTSAVFGAKLPTTVEEKRAFLLQNGIALWDVIASCDIENSADTSIRNAVPNDFSEIFQKADIGAVFTNGKLAHHLYQKHIGGGAVYLPSTSPANAAWTMERLIEAWRVIKPLP